MARFKKGTSGNPRGKPAGTKHKSTLIREAIQADLPAILGVLREKALAGDAAAAGLLLSRALPPLRAESPAVEVPVSGASLGERVEGVVAAVLNGSLSPSSAGELMGTLAQQARILEISELERRLAALEAQK